VLASLAAVPLLNVGGLLLCPHRGACLSALGQVSVWAAAAARSGLPLLALSLLVSAVRVGWLTHRASRLVAALPRAAGMPDGLRDALIRTGTRRVVCVAAEAPVAFCAGALRPRVVLSAELVQLLSPDELDAVLIHEQDHARRREPLVRAACQAGAEALFYVPLVGWWSQRHAAGAELRADRAAIRRVGARPVAGALLALGSGGGSAGSAAFTGAGPLRVAQVLGDPLPRPAPHLSLVGISVFGPYVAFVAASCIVQLVLYLLR